MSERKISQVVPFIAKKTPQVLATLAATVGAFATGTVEAWSSPALPNMKTQGNFGSLSSNEYSSIASFALLGALFSGPPTGWLIQKIGRKTTMMCLALPYIIGWALIVFSVNVPMLYAGRLITGFCAGASSLAVPVYIGETAEDNIRGMLGSGFQVMVTMGNLFVYVIGTFVSWQWLSVICAFIPLIGLVMMMLVPPSPRYLLSQGKTQEASKALEWLRGAKHSKQVEAELENMKASIENLSLQKTSRKEMRKSFVYKPVLVCLGLMFFQQLCGIEAVLVYTVDIFHSVESSIDPHLSTIIVGAIQVIVTLSSTALVERVGRRILLLISATVMSLSMFMLGLYFYFKDELPHVSQQMNWVPLATVMLFIMAFAIGFGPLAWTMMAELLPSSIIGKASAVATSFNWSLAYIVTQFFKPLQDLVGMPFSYSIYGAFSVLAVIFVFTCVPETKGKSLEDIQAHFAKSNLKVENDKIQHANHISSVHDASLHV